MSFFSELYDRAVEGVKNIDVGDSVNNLVNSFIVEQQKTATPLVKVGSYPTGNLTQKEIAAGVQPNQVPIAPPASMPMFNLASAKSILPIVAIAGVAAFFLFKRGK